VERVEVTTKPTVKLHKWFMLNHNLYGLAPDHPRPELREGVLCTSRPLIVETEHTIYELEERWEDNPLGPTYMMVKE